MEPEQARDRAAYGSIPAALIIIVQSIQLAFLLLKLFSRYPIYLSRYHQENPYIYQIMMSFPMSDICDLCILSKIADPTSSILAVS